MLAAVLHRHPELAGRSILTDQRTALRALGVRASLPPRSAATEPATYAAGLRRASAARVLTDPAGLGAFGWLMHAVDVPDDVLPQMRP